MEVQRLEYRVEAINSFAEVILIPGRINYSTINNITGEETAIEKNIDDFDDIVKSLGDYENLRIKEEPKKDASTKFLMIRSKGKVQEFKWQGEHFQYTVRLIERHLGRLLDIGL